MASDPDNPIPSVEASTNMTLALYQPAGFDVVMSNSDDIPTGSVTVNDPPSWLIAMHEQIARAHNQIREIPSSIDQERTQELATLREQYENLRDNYTLVTSMFRRGIEASQNQITQFQQQVQQASDRFASEVWTVIAHYGKQDAEHQKAIDHLHEISLRHQKALETLDERGVRQQSVLGRIDTWASTKESQINDILTKFVDQDSLRKFEEQITIIQQSTQEAIQKALEQSGQPGQAPDIASVMRVLEQRAATKAPSTVPRSSLYGPPASPSLIDDNVLQAAQAKRQASQARMQHKATYAGTYGAGSLRFG